MLILLEFELLTIEYDNSALYSIAFNFQFYDSCIHCLLMQSKLKTKDHREKKCFCSSIMSGLFYVANDLSEKMFYIIYS